MASPVINALDFVKALCEKLEIKEPVSRIVIDAKCEDPGELVKIYYETYATGEGAEAILEVDLTSGLKVKMGD